jgi:hypothetical protein
MPSEELRPPRQRCSCTCVHVCTWKASSAHSHRGGSHGPEGVQAVPRRRGALERLARTQGRNVYPSSSAHARGAWRRRGERGDSAIRGECPPGLAGAGGGEEQLSECARGLAGEEGIKGQLSKSNVRSRLTALRGSSSPSEQASHIGSGPRQIVRRRHRRAELHSLSARAPALPSSMPSPPTPALPLSCALLFPAPFNILLTVRPSRSV